MPAVPSQLRSLPAKPLGAPPAIWAAFARQGAWKSWVIAAQFGVIGLLMILFSIVLRRPPDVVLVQPDGKSAFVGAGVAGPELARFLAERRQQPSDLTVTRFAHDWLKLATAINSTTVDEAWPEALALCAQPQRERLASEAAKANLLESYKLARIRMELSVDELVLIERTDTLIHVRATVTRSKFSLLDPARPAEQDRLVHDIVLQVVPRTQARPDGLQISDWRAAPAAAHATVK
jgi:hypothetical protein